ncbi:MAG: Ig-like domain-containing protein, partial [Oscillospiraceae bacterium]
AAASGSSKADDKKAASKSSGGSHKGAKASSFHLENKADFVQSIQNQLETEECAEYGGTPVSAAQKPVSGFRGTFEDRAFRKKFAITLSIVFGAVVCFFLYAFYIDSLPPTLNYIKVSELPNSDKTVDVAIGVRKPALLKSGEVWCIASDEQVAPAADDIGWVLAEDYVCSLTVSTGSFYVYAMDSHKNITDLSTDATSINTVLSIDLGIDSIYLPKDGVYTPTVSLISFGAADESLVWKSSNTEVATVENAAVTGISCGEAVITATASNDVVASVLVLVTDLITLPDTETYSKPMLGADVFTDDEAALLDKILFARVAAAGGDGTRAAAVAAARFLTLEFPYRVPYFFENGRLDPLPGRPKCDGEGRYFHKGLYLSEDKYDILEVVRFGPATWGEYLLNWETKYDFVSGTLYPNGLDCSGFVSWVLCNGGTDVGDIGAGDEYGDNDLCDLADKVWLTVDYIQSDSVKVGDLIATDGHMAIIIGLTDEKIYIAESLFTSVRVMEFYRDASVVYSPLYDYVIPMDDIYTGDGNYTEMW